jgi:ABC-type antimicrobial peptide transport system ATPase subunit
MFPALPPRPNPKKSREFFGIRGFFFGRAGFCAAKPLFFRRRSPQTLAFRGRNGELWVELCCRFAWGGVGAFKGEDG